MTAATTDVTVENHGTLFRFIVHSEEGMQWVKDNVNIEDYMWQYKFETSGSFSVEHRFAYGLAEGMKEAGLSVD